MCVGGGGGGGGVCSTTISAAIPSQNHSSIVRYCTSPSVVRPGTEKGQTARKPVRGFSFLFVFGLFGWLFVVESLSLCLNAEKNTSN